MMRYLSINTTNHTMIVNAGGIGAVLAAMMAHPNVAGLQLQCFAALSLLAEDDGNATAIAAAGGIPVVLSAMTAHAGDAEVQEQGCLALDNIGWSDTLMQRRIKDEGGAVVVQAAVAALGATALCKEIGQELLGKLSHIVDDLFF